MDTTKPPTIKVEPRWLTLADVVMIVVGVAIGLSWFDFSTELRPATTPKGVEFYSLMLLVAGPVGTLALATSLAAFARFVRFKRGPRPGEWIVLVVCLAELAGTMRQAPDPFAWRQVTVDRPAVVTSLLGLAAAAAFLLAMSHWRDRPWARTVLLMSWLFALLCGPLAVARARLEVYQGRIYQDYESILGLPLDSSNATVQPWTLAADGMIGLGLVPEGLVYAVPAMAAVRSWRSRRRRPWLWTEWAGAAVAAVLLFCWIQDGILIAGRVSSWSPWPELIVRALWLVLVVGLAWQFTGRLAPAWRRWAARDGITAKPKAILSPLD